MTRDPIDDEAAALCLLAALELLDRPGAHDPVRSLAEGSSETPLDVRLPCPVDC